MRKKEDARRYICNKREPILSNKINSLYNAKHLVFLTTSRCNLSCKYCLNYLTEGQEDMSSVLAVSFLKNYFAHQTGNNLKKELRQITYLGGEPTINPEVMFKTMEWLELNGIPYLPILITNGIINDSLLERLIEKKMLFQISYDGDKNQLRIFKNVEATNNRIIKTIQRVSQSGLPIILRAVIGKWNVSLMENIVQFAADHGIETVYFSPIFNVGNAKKFKVPRAVPEAYLANYEKAIRKSIALGVRLYIVERARYLGLVNEEHSSLVLLPDGSLSVTVHYASAQDPEAKPCLIGKYSEVSGLYLDSKKMASLENNFLHNQRKFCMNCDCFDYCRGRSLGVVEFMTQPELSENDEIGCEISRGVYRLLDLYADRLR